ncbi:MAG: radical SAM protein [Clostridium sp.]|jgi:MoaA/NifB/PqqE/SkfB family radical SAM enzyme|uniref:radical SAM protein n=1 Tax=Clostridium sp. TaxID=1506 RepID=UPI0025C10224|nr:radical SAM protein [Clostridium sp.]MCH3963584.1 radical SAM protein [Clostridium sp.]MCI1714725.1 radical SAM protein [Clostridium sp.]MCI1799086.1 radical SAM protein [Clostridium sp.]MCI1812908.1 radical SAM protein [Clostridium sp.]MCI1869798.1 radical SAM protein [Clostridium sp.]
MKIKDNLEKITKQTIVNKIVGYLDKNPEENIDKIFKGIKMLTKDESALAQIEFVENYYNNDKYKHEYIQDILKNTDTKCLKKFFSCFFANANWFAGPKRQKYMEEEDTKIPFVMLLSPSMRCSLHCKGCYASSFSKKDDIPPEEVDRIIGEARDLGIYYIIILGGEPFFNDYLLDIYEKYDDIMFTPFTSGLFLDEKIADRLKKSGNVIPMLSIEGFEKDTDERRGKGTYKKVLKAMDILHERGILFGVSSAVTRTNINTVLSDEFTDMLIEKGSKMSWYFLFMPVNGEDEDFDMMLTGEQRDYLGRRSREMRANKPYFTLDFFNDAPYVGGCIAGKYFFHVNSKEDVEPCIFSHFSTVNLKGRHLIEAFRDPFFKKLRSMQPYNKNMLRPCSMIDNTNVIINVCKEVGAKPDDAGAEKMLHDPEFHEKIMKSSKEFAPYAEKTWKEFFKESGNDKFAKG